MELKPGTRLRSAACSTEIVVVKAPEGDVDLRCGGLSMLPLPDEGAPSGEPTPPFDEGTLVGKRYVSVDDSLEALCSKAGAGSLSVGGAALLIKGAKPLPSSD
ncbi:MAG TPA: hypothetical protein VK611_08460 [Acidimicrobiales bacterium]|nr:hypothetical protein [Acidimicrobiales bacterium]